MLQVEEAQALVMAEVVPGAAEVVPFGESHGRILREDVVATDDMPASDNSSMDGYAVRAADIAGAPVQLPVIGDIAAGHPASEPLRGRTAMRIMTGAFVPDGADTVVQVELTDGRTDRVTINKALPAGANVRRRGEDMRAGDVVVRAGVRIGPPEIAMLAAVQKTSVRVGRRPVVAILSTGDELIAIDEPRRAGTIVNTNGHLLDALVREAGAIPRMLGIVRDTQEATVAAFESALDCDFILSSGGVSVGAFDYVKSSLEALGAESRFWRVAMKPGKPVVLSRLRDRVVLGLPGNPVSCLVSFHLFVAPALRKAMGQEHGLLPPIVKARLTAPLSSSGERRVYARVHLAATDGDLLAHPLTSQGSGSLTSMTGANGLAIIREGVRGLGTGAVVECALIGAL